MIRLISILAFGLLVSNTWGQEKIVEISGTISNAEGAVLKANAFVNNKQVTIDSVTLNKKGKYNLSVGVSGPEFFSIMTSPDAYVLVVLDSNDAAKGITLNADASDFVKSHTVVGNTPSVEISKFTKKVYQYQADKQAIGDKMYAQGTSFEERNTLQSKNDSTDKAFKETIHSFIDKNYKSIASIVTIGYLNPIDDLEYLRKIEGGLLETVPESDYYIGVKTQLTQIETQIKIQEEQEKKKKELEARTAIGAVAPELNFKSPTGEVITLESLRGNYVLIDFWASWCRPCRMENPNVVNLYNKYAKDGFTVYSVSLDKSQASWEQAIIQDGLIWPNHVSDLKQWQTEATQIYGFGGIPYTVLIDKEGKIIAKQLRGPSLEQALKDIFGY